MRGSVNRSRRAVGAAIRKSACPLAGAVLLTLLLASPSETARRRENYPKLLVYTSAIGQLSDATLDSLSWYDVVVCADRPEALASLRDRNPSLRFLWSLSPQFATPPSETDDPWWLPDTLWSPSRLIQLYAQRNDWYLRDTQGQPITDGHSYVLNWTRYCPVGTFGSARGLRAAEWIARVALPEITLSQQPGATWGWNSRTTYNGIMFEIISDCLGSYGWQLYEQADPDRDGIAEGVYSACSTGGAEDPLSVLMREENEVFYEHLQAAFPKNFVFLSNENNRYIGPSWCVHLSGMKLENWMRPSTPGWMDWWDWFYGLTPPWDPPANWGAGYAWTEGVYDRPVADSLKGWDLSFIEVWAERDRSDEENRRQMRFGLGTTMLGDGYFTYTRDQRHPLWQREFDWDFGLPLGTFEREVPPGGDTLYVRSFSQGLVEVNPNDVPVEGVPPRDTRFTFWQPATDLTARATRPHALLVTWTAPLRKEDAPYLYELRHSTDPISIETWNSATPYAGNPVSVPAASPTEVTLLGLRAGVDYYVAVRTQTRRRLEPVLSNLVLARPLAVRNEPSPRFPSRSDPESTLVGETNTNGDGSPILRSGLVGIAPNPSSSGTTISLAISPNAELVRVTIEAVTGRVVRDLGDPPFRSGTGSLLWDGCDEQGTPAPAGVYFVKLSWRGGADSRKVLILR